MSGRERTPRGALYAGSFDPPTNGHLDLIRRGVALFGRLVVGVAENPEKHPLFPAAERVEMLREVAAGLAGVEVRSYQGLTVTAARAAKCTTLLRGVRGPTDLEQEQVLAMTNRALAPEIETVLVLAAPEWAFCSSRLVREAARLGGDVSTFVPPTVLARLAARLASAGGGPR